MATETAKPRNRRGWLVVALVLAVMDVVLVTAALAGLEETAVTRTAAPVIGSESDSTDGHARCHQQRYH